MNRRPNPFGPRLRYVADNYGLFVTLKTAQAWMEATGQDWWVGESEDAYTKGSFRTPHGVFKSAVAAAGTGQVTRFDRYLPWFAKALNGELKSSLKTIRRLTGTDVRDWSEVQDVSFKPAPDSPLGQYREAPIAKKPALRRAAAEYKLAYDHGNVIPDTMVRLFRSIVDWAEDEKVDLMRVSGLSAVEESERWSLERKIKPGKIPQGEVVHRFPDGWTVQELGLEGRGRDAQAELDVEGDVMQHCVGDYNVGRIGYDYRIFSLRDPKGSPHATMEWHPDEQYVVQLRGKQNDTPKSEYLSRMVDFRLKYLDPKLHERHQLEGAEAGDHWDRFRDRLVGVFTVPAWGPSRYAAYEGDRRSGIIEEAELDEFIDQTKLSAQDTFFDRPGQRQYVIDSLDRVHPTQHFSPSAELEDEAWIAWELWKRNMGPIERSGDEMAEWLWGAKVDPSVCLPFDPRLSATHRGERPPLARNPTRLKRRLIR